MFDKKHLARSKTLKKTILQIVPNQFNIPFLLGENVRRVLLLKVNSALLFSALQIPETHTEGKTDAGTAVQISP